MSDWSDRQSAVQDAKLRTFGEDIELAGRGVVVGIFELIGLPVELRTRGSDTGARLGIDQQANPVLHLRTADADGLLEGDAVTVRGVAYLVVRLDPDGAGLTRAELMLPGAEIGPQPSWNQWR